MSSAIKKNANIPTKNINNRQKYMWNPVFERVMEIKDAYVSKFGQPNYNNENVTLTDNVLSDMIEATGLYKDWLPTLVIRQNGPRILLHYNIINTDNMWKDKNDINREARSIYIDLEKEAIVLCPFRKFFNIDEVEENKTENIQNQILNTKVFEVSDKLDGSNQNATWFNNEIVLCGSGACDPTRSWQLEEGYKMIQEYEQMLKDNEGKTFMFEFIHPDDIHVVEYDEKDSGLYLIAYRDNYTGRTSSYSEAIDMAERYGAKHINIEKYSFDELTKMRKKFKAADKEGWVINMDGHRVKFKTDDYLLTFKFCTGTINLTEQIIKNIADGTIDDFMASAPNDKKLHDKMLKQIEEISEWGRKISDEINTYYKSLPGHSVSQKEFALKVQSDIPQEYQRFMYMLRAGKPYNVFKKGKKYVDAEEIGITILRGQDVKPRIDRGVFQNVNKEQYKTLDTQINDIKAEKSKKVHNHRKEKEDKIL